MRPETLENDAPEGPKWLQNGSKMTPKLLPGGFREALGRRGRFLSDFWVYFGHRFGTKKSLKNNRKARSGFELHFWTSGGLLGQFWGRLWGHVGCFLAAQPRSGQNRENHEK